MGTHQSKQSIGLRIGIFTILLFSIPIIPWYIHVFFWIGYVVLYTQSYEILLVTIFFDGLYTVSAGFLFFPATLGVGCVMLLIAYLRPRVAFLSDR